MSDATAVHGLVEEFFKITKIPHDPLTRAFLNRCQSHTIKVNGRFYKYYQAGTGPTVLHVHGIHSNLGSMVPIAEELLEHGYRVVLFDAPAHGEALGTTTDPLEVRDAIRGLYGRLHEFHAVVGHSLGGLWALAAWDSEVRAKTIVSISAPSSQRFLVSKFAELHQVDDDRSRQLVAEIEQRLGSAVWTEFSPAAIVQTIDVPGLVVHGAKDDYVPLEHAEELHSNWRQSTMELVEDAGHFDIVGSPAVRQVVSKYLQGVG